MVTMEENAIHGGFGSAVLELLNVSGITTPTLSFGIPDRFIGQGNLEEQRRDAGLSAEHILNNINESLKKNRIPIRKKSIKLTRKKAS